MRQLEGMTVFCLSFHFYDIIFSSIGIETINILKGCIMATYECSECGMAVNAACAKCDAPLVNDMLTIDDGKQVQISKCPNDHGKIKSPTCCGKDMTCTT